MHKTNASILRNNRFIRIAVNTLIFDAALFLYTEFFLYSLLTRGEMLYRLFSLDWLAFMGPIIAFFITWHVGFIASRISHRIKNRKLARVPFIVFIWIPASMFFFIDRNLTGISGGALDGGQHFWSYFGVLVGILSGILFGVTENAVEEGKSVLRSRLEGMMVPSALFFFYLGFYSAFHHSAPPAVFFCLLFGELLCPF